MPQAHNDAVPPGERVLGRRPLDDIRIIAVEQYGAGPFGSVLLADLGADVIKIEDPRTRGDPGRYVPPHQHGEDSLFYETFNRNKRSLALDLANRRGRGVFEALVRSADALYANLRGDVPERLRLRFADLRHLNPKIICCFISGYGRTGSAQSVPGYDYLLQGAAGWMSMTGEPESPPAKAGLSLVDYSAGYAAALGLLAAVHAARRDGLGMDCDVSLFDTAIHLLTYQATWYLTAGEKPVRRGRSAHPSLVPFQNFPTATDWIVVACPKEKFWMRLAEALGKPEWISDPRFATFAMRKANEAELIPLIDEILMARPADFWLEKFRNAGVPCGPILDIPAALDQPLVAERELLVETEHPRFGTVRQIASPVRIASGTPAYHRAPQRNESAREILLSLGYDDTQLRQLAAEGAFG
jgi:crotonobetainyl-CoA:carnitine CoA-transferase CaiB-like acyl-CoA transferase